jgi:chorismate synthase
MDANTFGKYFRWTTFGESHGTALGVVIDGCPSGVPFSEDILRHQMNRRRPGQIDTAAQEVLVTPRGEKDDVEILSGIFEGTTLGTPISCVVKNKEQRPQDYDAIKKSPRIGHADDVWKNKFEHTDHRGGGRASARETLGRVIAGSIAQMFLQTKYPELTVTSFVTQIGPLKMTLQDLQKFSDKKMSVDASVARFPTSQQTAVKDLLLKAKAEGESFGGCVETWIEGAPAGLGEPVFEKLKSKLAYAMMSVGATCSFEIGAGKDMIDQPGSLIHTQQNAQVYGGIRGGISTGERIVFKLGFKPTSTIGSNAKDGRHDPCVLPRAVPIVEAMAWVVLADLELAQRSNNV